MQQEFLLRLQRIDHLIRIKNTGTPAQLAKRLGVSERTVYEYLNLMKDFGAPIKFNNYRQSYYYDQDGCFSVSFSPSQQVKNGTKCPD
ncbi:MAG: HTH domain-containing protein [Chitinophagaceae bacterium]